MTLEQIRTCLKSVSPDEIERVVNLITNYWLNLNESPLILARK